MSDMKHTGLDPNTAQEVIPAHMRKVMEFGLNADDIGRDPNAPTEADLKIKEYNEGLQGWNGKGAHSVGAGRKNNQAAELAAKNTARQASASADASNALAQANATLSSTFIKVSKDGFLQENGKTVTLERKMELEDKSKQNSTGLTEEEVAMEKYMSGETEVVPDALKQMAEERGIKNPTGEPLSRDDYAEIIHAELPNHIAGRVTGGGIDVENAQDLLPPTAPAAPTQQIAAPGLSL